MAYRKNKMKSPEEFTETPETLGVLDPSNPLELDENVETPEILPIEENLEKAPAEKVMANPPSDQGKEPKVLEIKRTPKKMPIRIHPIEGKYARPLRNIQKFKTK